MKRLLFLLVVLLLLSAQITIAQTPLRIGILGDSDSDEYRADDNRAGGTAYEETTLNWAELVQRYRGIDFGTWGNRSEPRRIGYAYNWARSAATTATMISSGQVSGLAAQVAAGDVDYVVIFIGTNDFHVWNNTYQDIYNGILNDAQVQQKVDDLVSGIAFTVNVILNAGPDGILLVNVRDPGLIPGFSDNFPNASGRARVTSAINAVNMELAELASQQPIALADTAAFMADFVAQIDENDNLIIGGETISVLMKGYEPHHISLDDSVGHGGTVASGLLANFIMGELAAGYDLVFTPFSDSEILANAGISASQLTPTPTAMPTFTPTATPTPTLTFTPTVTPTPTATPQSSVLTLPINSGANDVNEVNNVLTANGNPMWIGNGGTTTTSYTGLRFTGVNIPQGATITEAHIEVRSAMGQWITLSFQFRGEAANNSAAFSAGSRPSQRILTGAQVAHSSNTNWASGQWIALNDIKTIIQEIVNRPGWQSGNSLSLIVKGTGGTWSRKFVTSFEGSAAQAIRLVITVS